MQDLTPLTESEFLCWYTPVRIHLNKDTTINFIFWTCYCGVICRIATRALNLGTKGGTCQCQRDWNVDLVDMTAIPVEPVEPRYKFPLVLDRGASWRVWRKKPVGI